MEAPLDCWLVISPLAEPWLVTFYRKAHQLLVVFCICGEKNDLIMNMSFKSANNEYVSASVRWKNGKESKEVEWASNSPGVKVGYHSNHISPQIRSAFLAIPTSSYFPPYKF